MTGFVVQGHILHIVIRGTIDSFQSRDRLEDLEGKTSIERCTSVSIFHLFPSRKYLDHLSKE